MHPTNALSGSTAQTAGSSLPNAFIEGTLTSAGNRSRDAMAQGARRLILQVFGAACLAPRIGGV